MQEEKYKKRMEGREKKMMAKEVLHLEFSDIRCVDAVWRFEKKTVMLLLLLLLIIFYNYVVHAVQT